VTDTDGKPPLDFPELESGGGGVSADEFANVPSPRRRHPAIALGTTALAVFLLYQIHEDLFYALSHSQARDLGDARTVAATPLDQLPLNEYVRLTGMADRESGVIIDTAGSWRFTQFFRLLGTQSRIFVSRVPDPIPVEQAERDVFVGRLVRFRDLSFQAAIRKHFANRVTATHFFAPSAVRDKISATPGGSFALPDLMGEQVALAPNDQVSIDVRGRGEVLLVIPLPTGGDVAAARAAVEQQGAKVLDEPPAPTDDKSVAVVASFPEEGRDRAMNAVSELDPKVRFRPVRATYSSRIADLMASPDGFKVKAAAGEKELPLSRILAVRTVANVQIPDDALLVREGERPRDQLKVLIAGIFLLGFALLNLLSLRVRS
jgi:hypothetical protein